MAGTIVDYLRKIGAKGGKKHNGKKTRDTLRKKYGEDHFKKLAKLSVLSRQKKTK